MTYPDRGRPLFLFHVNESGRDSTLCGSGQPLTVSRIEAASLHSLAAVPPIIRLGGGGGVTACAWGISPKQRQQAS